MKLIIYVNLLTFILCSNFKMRNVHEVGGYVIFGSQAKPAKWKWMAAILIEQSKQFYQHCGGSLVSEQHIITAAHCLFRNGSLLSTQSIIVRLGQYDLRKKGGLDFKVAYYVTHPKFNIETLDNDIAVIKLAKKVKLNKRISPIKLPGIASSIYETEKGKEVAFIAGWGRTSFQGEFSDELLEARLHLVNQSDCRSAYETYLNISTQHICAGAPENIENGGDACPGDSGGPLVQFDLRKNQFVLTGVISFGRKCGLKNVPGVYARVDFFARWLRKLINVNDKRI